MHGKKALIAAHVNKAGPGKRQPSILLPQGLVLSFLPSLGNNAAATRDEPWQAEGAFGTLILAASIIHTKKTALYVYTTLNICVSSAFLAGWCLTSFS